MYANDRLTRGVTAICLVVVLGLTYTIFMAGIRGPFVLDDYVNLGALAQLPRSYTWPNILSFLFSDTGHSGRYLARLTFFLQRSSWPEHADHIKQANLYLHLINGALLFWVLVLVFRIDHHVSRQRFTWITLLVFALWLLHPLNVSTVLYAVQRQTILAGTCMLFGFALYILGRRIAIVHALRGYFVMSVGTIVGTVLGSLCKETAILFSLFVVVIELTLMHASTRPKYWKRWAWLFLAPPILFVLAWHVYNFNSLVGGYGTRDFTMAERVLTQGRVLLTYLGYILFPTRSGTGLFHDDIILSTSLWSPLATMLSWSAIAGLIALGTTLRRKTPVLSFAILWFFGGHLIESGIIPLEIYFEHRNYIPMIGPLTAVAYYGVLAVTHLRIAGMVAVIGYTCVLVYNAHQNVSIWKSQASMALAWEIEHPDSPRALQFAADTWLQAGHIGQAERRIEQILTLRPASTGAAAQLVQLACLNGKHDALSILQRYESNLLKFRLDRATLPTLEQVLLLIKDGRCPELSLKRLEKLLDSLLKDSYTAGDTRARAQILLLKAKIYNILQQPQNAAQALSDSFHLYPQYRVAVLESVAWWQASDRVRALDAVERAKKYRCRKLGVLCVQTDELKNWENRLRQEPRPVNK